MLFRSGNPSWVNSRTYGNFSPACDIEENEDHVLIALDVPGISKDDIKLEVKDRELVISGERKLERKGENRKGTSFQERSQGRFMRKFSLGPMVNVEKIDAKYRDGVLQVRLPKNEEAKPKTIPITEFA